MISIVIVTYNSINVLPKCLESLECCSNAKKLEIIIVDNCSTDGTRSWIERYKMESFSKYASMKCLQLEENLGYAFANNRGSDLAGGGVLLFLNPDTIVSTKVIEACTDKLLSDETIGAIGCRLVLPSGKLDKACRRSLPTLWNSFARFSRLAELFSGSKFLASYNLTYLDEESSYEVGCICGAFMMMPKCFFDSLGGFDEDYFMYGEDVDLCFHIRKSGYRIWYEGSLSTVHLKGGNGGKKTFSSLKHFYGTMGLYVDKNFSKKFALKLVLKIVLKLFSIIHYSYYALKSKKKPVL